jgi:hypothetical protein
MKNKNKNSLSSFFFGSINRTCHLPQHQFRRMNDNENKKATKRRIRAACEVLVHNVTFAFDNASQSNI